MFHPPAEYQEKILNDPGPYTQEEQDRNKNYIGRYYTSRNGPHMFEFIQTMGQGTVGNLYVKVSGKEINFSSPFPLADHPGNINSGGNTAGIDGTSLDGSDTFRCFGRYPQSVAAGDKTFGPGRFLSDTKLNKKFGGISVYIGYDYLDNYDADVKI